MTSSEEEEEFCDIDFFELYQEEEVSNLFNI